MVAGNPDRIAFVIEKVSDWSSCGFTNGIIQLYINGICYPKEIRTATINTEINSLLESTSPIITMPKDDELFCMPSYKLFETLYDMMAEKGDYRYKLPLQEIEDAGYYIFMVCSNNSTRFVIAEYKGTDNIVYKDEVITDIKEIFKIKDSLQKFKEILMI